jgi:starvation-inducible outer membrane lipoprotein
MKTKTVLCMTAAMVLSACVTINIYFPAAAAEKAADKIIDEVWQLQKQANPTQSGQPASSATPPKQ